MYADRLFNALERNDPAPGMLLVAAPGMLAPEFARSVILLIEHSDGLTAGVDLTTRSEVAVFNVMPEWMPVVAKPQALYIGGPLNQQAVIAVGRTQQGVDMDKHPNLTRLAPRLAHVNMHADPEDMQAVMDGMRFFAGYAEWAPGQLEEEIERGDWFVAPALPQDVIMPGGADLWGDVLKRQEAPLPFFATFPTDVANN